MSTGLSIADFSDEEYSFSDEDAAAEDAAPAGAPDDDAGAAADGADAPASSSSPSSASTGRTTARTAATPTAAAAANDDTPLKRDTGNAASPAMASSENASPFSFSSSSSSSAAGSTTTATSYNPPGTSSGAATPLADQNSFYARLNALSAGRGKANSRTAALSHGARTQPPHARGSPVRTRLEQLSNRLAARAQQIAQEKRERESAILDHVQAIERQLRGSDSRMAAMERKVEMLSSQLQEERKARIDQEKTFHDQLTSLVHRVGRVKQDLEGRMDENRSRAASQLQAIVEDAGSSVNLVNDLNQQVRDLTQRVTGTERLLPAVQTDAQEARRLVEIERKVKAETQGMLMKLLDETFSKFREDMATEHATRERNEEAMLQILENLTAEGPGQ